MPRCRPAPFAYPCADCGVIVGYDEDRGHTYSLRCQKCQEWLDRWYAATKEGRITVDGEDVSGG